MDTGYSGKWGADRRQGVCSLKANPGYDMNKIADIV